MQKRSRWHSGRDALHASPSGNILGFIQNSWKILHLQYLALFFLGSWSKGGMAKHLGINSSYISGHHCYVLVRVSRYRRIGKMDPVDLNVDVDEGVLQAAETLQLGDEASVYKFLRDYGSHYVVSYTTGNALYQVSNLFFIYLSTRGCTFLAEENFSDRRLRRAKFFKSIFRHALPGTKPMSFEEG